MIERELGFAREKTVYADLDHLASTWSSADTDEFEKNTTYFEQIDEELWK